MANDKSKKGMKLHKYIAAGGDIKSFQGAQGINADTIPGVQKKGSDSKKK